MKTCKACGEAKEVDQFHKDKSKTDGLNAYCKPCTIARQRTYAAQQSRRVDPPGQKTCSSCKVIKPSTEFHAAKERFDGLRSTCKACCFRRHEAWRLSNKDKAAADQKKWRDNNPERSADHQLKLNYGVPLGTYARMFAEQKGLCAICKTDKPGGRPRADGTPARFHVDHCHDTGRIRGLLCHHCNVGIGNFKHNPDLIRKAIAYVKVVE